VRNAGEVVEEAAADDDKGVGQAVGEKTVEVVGGRGIDGDRERDRLAG